MTATRIISADGTIYIPLTAARRRNRRLALIIASIIALPFLLAALVGVGMAATGNTDALETTASHRPAGISLAKVDKACAPAGKALRDACRSLYLRRDWHTANTYTPAGPALVKECIAQYRGIELRYCLTQEV